MIENSPIQEKNVLDNLVDIQSSYDSRSVAIRNVGVKGVRHPLVVTLESGEQQRTVANIAMTVGLHPEVKGTHMSRFIELLHDGEFVLSYQSLMAIMPKMLERLDSHSGKIEINFPFFTTKKAPESGVESLLDHDVSVTATMDQGSVQLEYKVVVPVTSLCPCSKEISKYGAHNQRSAISISAEVIGPDLTIERLIALAESSASCDLYGILKRPDEKYVTEKAYENPMFVEDMVREVSVALNEEHHIGHFRIEVENFESIHNHSAYAVVDSDDLS